MYMPQVTLTELPHQAIDRLSRTYATLKSKCSADALDEQEVVALLTETQHLIDVAKRSGAVDRARPLPIQLGARKAAVSLMALAPWLTKATRLKIQTFIDAQPEFLDSVYRFTEDYSGNYMSLWPNIFAELRGRDDLNFLEVGSFEGMSAVWLLTNVLTSSSSHLTCIDPFENDDPAQALFDVQRDSEGRSSYDRFIYNISLTGHLDKVAIVKGRSDRALREIPVGSVDAAYIDGSHLALDVLQDAVLSWGALKLGGLLIFDDYCWESPYSKDPLCTPRPAINAFLNIFAQRIKTLHIGSQVVLQKVE
jgi:predicted O-methyltransferase YrrM